MLSHRSPPRDHVQEGFHPAAADGKTQEGQQEKNGAGDETGPHMDDADRFGVALGGVAVSQLGQQGDGPG